MTEEELLREAGMWDSRDDELKKLRETVLDHQETISELEEKIIALRAEIENLQMADMDSSHKLASKTIRSQAAEERVVSLTNAIAKALEVYNSAVKDDSVEIHQIHNILSDALAGR